MLLLLQCVSKESRLLIYSLKDPRSNNTEYTADSFVSDQQDGFKCDYKHLYSFEVDTKIVAKCFAARLEKVLPLKAVD